MALWLGLYLVTRNPRYPIAWLTALTLWCMVGLFLNILMAINPPPPAPFLPAWMHFLFPFWPVGTFEGEPMAWLQGWSVIPAIVFWHHATTLMRPGRLNIWRWTRILVAYALAVIAIVVQTNTPILFTVERGNPLYLNSLMAGSWYPFFGIALVVLTVACVINLVLTARVTPEPTPRSQMEVLVSATLVAGLAGPLSLAGSAFQLPIPIVALSLAVGIPVGMIGYGVARFSALTEGRTIRRDFLYNLILLVLVVAVYLLASWILIQAYNAPAIMLVFIPVLAVLTHSLMNTAFRLTEPLLYGQSTHQMRAVMRHLVHMAGEDEALEENLITALDTLCAAVRASYGLILAFEGQDVHRVAACRWDGEAVNLKPDDLSADDVLYLASGQLRTPLQKAALLIPLYAQEGQIGALVLGRPVNGISYAPEEVVRLMNLSDQIADAMCISRLKKKYMQRIVRLAEGRPSQGMDSPQLVPVEAVESALRHLNDYTYLADSPLANMKVVHERLSHEQNTHLDRGKIVHDIVLETLERLCPESNISRDPPPREWYPYLILRDAYLEEIPNRDIMLRLYISEGTFNRTRRSAIRSVARALGEIELSLS